MARYGKAAGKSVERAVRREKKGTLKSGKGGKGGRVKSRKQAIAIGLSEARKKGAKVPRKKSSRNIQLCGWFSPEGWNIGGDRSAWHSSQASSRARKRLTVTL